MIERVQKIIAASGMCSKRKAEDLIKNGVVKVNGNVIKLGDKADYEKDIITVNDKKVFIQKKVYYAFYKPRFVLTSAVSQGGKRTIYDIMQLKEKVFYAGRLDYDAEGLIILTNDGDYANRIAHPRFETKKTYRVFLDKKIDNEDAKKLSMGIELEEGMTKGAFVRILSSKEIEITIHEGWKHIVKRMLEKLGYKVIRLIRVRIGNVGIGDLEPGQHRTLKPHEIKFIK
jgi:23S rRNA pseudouridine2605 synthase